MFDRGKKQVRKRQLTSDPLSTPIKVVDLLIYLLAPVRKKKGGKKANHP